MIFTLYDAVVPAYHQSLGALAGLIDRGEAYALEQDLAPSEIIGARLADDMLPFGYQIKAAAAHSAGAIDGVRHGVFQPDRGPWPDDFAGLRALTQSARDAIDAIDPAEIETFLGRDMRFDAGPIALSFVAEQFLLSFSLPNFYFHVTTAYDILRWKGLNIGKRDFIGALRTREA